MQFGAILVLKCTTHSETDLVANGSTNLPNSNWLRANSRGITANSVYSVIMIMSLSDLYKTITKCEIFLLLVTKCTDKCEECSVTQCDQLSSKSLFLLRLTFYFWNFCPQKQLRHSIGNKVVVHCQKKISVN